MANVSDNTRSKKTDILRDGDIIYMVKGYIVGHSSPTIYTYGLYNKLDKAIKRQYDVCGIDAYSDIGNYTLISYNGHLITYIVELKYGDYICS